MVHEVSGDVPLRGAEGIVHALAADDHSDSGLALLERWPAVFNDFRHRCHVEHHEPGAAWIWSGPGAHIVALLTQEEAPKHGGHPGRATPTTSTERSAAHAGS